MTGMSVRSREPVSRRGGPARPALSRAAIVAAALAVADRDGLDAVSMRRVAEELDTGASALYVYIENRDDLLVAMFDHAMAPVAERPRRPATGVSASVAAPHVHKHGQRTRRPGPDRARRRSPGPNATVMTKRVRDLLAEGGMPEATIPAALDLLGLFVTAAALDRVPVTTRTPALHQQRLHWEIDVILNGLIAAARLAPDRQAARQGGLWLCRVRPSGLTAVVVPSAWQVSVQAQRWMTVRWWNRHSRARLPRLVGPPSARRVR